SNSILAKPEPFGDQRHDSIGGHQKEWKDCDADLAEAKNLHTPDRCAADNEEAEEKKLVPIVCDWIAIDAFCGHNLGQHRRSYCRGSQCIKKPSLAAMKSTHNLYSGGCWMFRRVSRTMKKISTFAPRRKGLILV